MKPHKGSIWAGRKVTRMKPCEEHLGFYVVGIFVNHPEFQGHPGYTSMVVKFDEETGEFETLNSRYTFLKSEYTVIDE